ncbi:ubiquitin-like protein Pup [Streptomyces pseudovenezuelae]|uniref:ubiquitin-like protein Pup n=1 Tax=Streptomyces pseudovenezuelae TaxID=67350 RepID=UPI0039A5C1B4
MYEFLISGGGVLAAIVAAVVGYAAYRHQKRQDERVVEREHAVSLREQAADEREKVAQASRLHVVFIPSLSRLVAGAYDWTLRVQNTSSQPLTDLNATYQDQELRFDSSTGHLTPGAIRRAKVPSHLVHDRPLHSTTVINFSDANGTRWRRFGNGSLQYQIVEPSGSSSWSSIQNPEVEHVPDSTVDTILDEIDDVLEENSEPYRRSFLPPGMQ